MPGTQALGVSTFHVSCSDDNMDSADDCNKPQGDGKGLTGLSELLQICGAWSTATNVDLHAITLRSRL